MRPTLDSVAAQRWPCVEHIIMDGASTDGTADIAREYMSREGTQGVGHTVVLVSERDGGLYDAMNKGLRLATGDYVVFLNAGDTLPAPDTLGTVAGCVDGGLPPAVLYGDTDIVDGEGRFLGHRRLSPPERLTWRSFMRGMLVCHQAFYARSDIAKAEPYDLRYRYSADVDWCIRIMRRASRERLRLVNTHTVLAHYLDGGMSVANHRASLKERFRVMAGHYGLAVTTVMHLWFVARAVLRR